MRNDLERPLHSSRPLVGVVENLEASPQASDQDRDRDILMTLRRRLRDRSIEDTVGQGPWRQAKASGEDKYEPQRLNRKICWQYDVHAKKVPLLRRHYI
jgi:hypothetical protein